jgi:hypothetical protein
MNPVNRESPSRETPEEYNEESPNTPTDNNKDNDNSPKPPNDNEEDPDLSTPTPNTPTTARMASFDSGLKHLVVDIIKYKITHPLAMALDQAFVSTFNEFHSIEIADVNEFTYKASVTSDTVKLHTTLVKQIQRGVAYACYEEDMANSKSDDPTLWDANTFSRWTWNSYVTYLTTVAASAATIAAMTLGSTTTTIISTSQKDNEAALISWSRKPHDVAKYPFLKTDADYQDWKLKMKRQLIADTLSQVTEPTFTLYMCRAGTDHELAMLQINFFEQILSAVLLNPKGKGLVTTHPKDALFVWKEHEAHQNAPDSAQRSTTILMNKLMALKIADSPTRHSFLISFQELCNRDDQIADVNLAESFKWTLLQASIMHDTALLNSCNTVNEVKRTVNPLAKPATYNEFITFLVNQSKTHDIATPYKRNVRHAHKTNFDSFSDGNDDLNDDEMVS